MRTHELDDCAIPLGKGFFGKAGLERTSKHVPNSANSEIEAVMGDELQTEGHSRRVTDLTVRLAEKLGIYGEQLAQVYPQVYPQVSRGALLPDIGNMGIPDAILKEHTDEARPPNR